MIVDSPLARDFIFVINASRYWVAHKAIILSFAGRDKQGRNSSKTGPQTIAGRHHGKINRYDVCHIDSILELSKNCPMNPLVKPLTNALLPAFLDSQTIE